MKDFAKQEIRKVADTPGKRGGPEKFAATLALADQLLHASPRTGTGHFVDAFAGTRTSMDSKDAAEDPRKD